MNSTPVATPGAVGRAATSSHDVLVVDDIGLVYEAETRGESPRRVLDGVSFSVARGRFVCIVGRSGCGKTSLLRILAGLLPATEGVARYKGTPIEAPRRDVAFVFQDHNLLPWKSVRANIAWGAKQLGMPASEREASVGRLLGLMGLEEYADALPRQLSGGMRQRVGIARALCTNADLLLMDEPLGALDAETRERLQVELLRVLEHEGKTVLMVTHSIDEAITLGDEVVLMTANPGRIADVVDIDFPHPRATRLAEYRRDPRWTDYRERLWSHLRADPASANA
jgi:NitT/TauT family transport system ATP-binding protein